MDKQKPIIFSTPMIQAIFEGRKTQTRRVIKPANPVKASRMGGYSQGNGLWIDGYTDAKEARGSIKDYSISPCWQRLEYYMRDYAPYKPGEILWVREAWGISIMMAGGIIYKADWVDKKPPLADGEKWRSPIHMPCDAARIFLRVKDVRAERIQEIQWHDVIDEGIHVKRWQTDYSARNKAVKQYATLWDRLNAERGYGWDVNPWVWVIEFERMMDYEPNVRI